MKIQDLSVELAHDLQCKFLVQQPFERNNAEWRKVLVLDNRNNHPNADIENVIGHLLSRNNEIYGISFYKNDQRRDITYEDTVHYRLERFLQDGSVISLVTSQNLIDIAQAIVEEDLEQKIQWRYENPKLDKNGNIVPRKKLQGRNPRYVLRSLILNISDNVEEFKTSIQTIITDVYKLHNFDIRV